MSTLTAMYRLDGRPIRRSDLTRVADAGCHVTPDRAGEWTAGPLGLAHRALDTTPEIDIVTQPHADPATGLVVVLDGRVDNRTELCEALDRCDVSCRSSADAELVLRAYQAWGDDGVTRLVGDFAFVLWDARRRRLLCGRDPSGFRPLYYHASPTLLCVASGPRQVLDGAGLAPRPNEAMVAEYLANDIIDTTGTLLAGVERLPPGHTLAADGDGVRVARYWPGDVGALLRYPSDDDYAEHFRALLEEAVRCRLRSRGPVGVELSGGLDSSSVTAMAAALTPAGAPALDAYSLVFPDHGCDERRWIDEVVTRSRVRSHRLAWQAPVAADFAASIAHHRDLPVYPNAAMAGPLRAMARGRGCRVLLTGNGGDQWLTGSPRHYADLARAGRVAALARELRADAADPTVARPPFALLRLGLWPLVPASLRRLARPGRRRPVPAWIGTPLARRVHLAERLARRPPDEPAFASRAQLDLYRMSTAGHEVHFAEMEARSTAALGIETRHPLMDRRIVEFALALPGEQRRQRGRTKHVLRTAMAARLPRSVLERRDKANFSHTFDAAFGAYGGAAAFERLTIADLGWVDGSRVRALYRRLADEPDTRRHTAMVWPLWMVLAIELWFRAVCATPARAAALGA